jgi:hypothetical protein
MRISRVGIERKLGRRAAIWAMTLVGTCCIANAGLVDVAFYNSGYGGTQPTGAAVLGQAGDQWNWIDGMNCPSCPGPVSLTDTNGNATGVSLSFQADGAVVSAATNTQPDPDLTNNYLFNNSSGSILLTLDGLIPSQNYLLVLYVASDDASGGNRSLTGTVAGATTVPFAATGDPQPTFINGENVVALNVTSDASGSLAITESDGPLNSGEVDLNGLQIETPEPASLGLLSFGLALLAWRTRRATRRS